MPITGFIGSSGAGEYGDFVQQVDASVGAIMKTLDSMGLAKNTMIVFTSDNGPYWREDYVNKFQHKSAGPWRGMKGDAFEGGHRVPFIVKWPGNIKPGAVSAATTTLANLMSTAAEIVGNTNPRYNTEDSYSILSVLKGKSTSVDNQPAVVHSSSIGYFVIRIGDWKLIQGLGSGGFTVPKQIAPKPGEAKGQLYHLAEDSHEDKNLYDQYPEKVKALTEMLNQIRNASTRVNQRTPE
jgi:arylsulfatase A-like enzyme